MTADQAPAVPGVWQASAMDLLALQANSSGCYMRAAAPSQYGLSTFLICRRFSGEQPKDVERFIVRWQGQEGGKKRGELHAVSLQNWSRCSADAAGCRWRDP
jgi:hypothetical protein